VRHEGELAVTEAEQLEAIAATEIERLHRLATIGEWGTAGPDDHRDGIVDVVHADHPCFVDGWWSHAKQMKAHPGRIGGPINPYASVVHTTDMLPDEWDALIKAWIERGGDGSCATFLIGRDEAHGVLQFCPVTRNANHAGGSGHGVFDHARATGVHPNLVAVGIELHCAGGVQRVNGLWRLVEQGKAHGMPLPDADVIADPHRPGRGWHVVTDYQRERLTSLLADLEGVLAPMPAGLRARSTGEASPAWATPKTPRVVTHAWLDPAHRADPWPPTCAWLRG
jgi:hypothetical protein